MILVHKVNYTSNIRKVISEFKAFISPVRFGYFAEILAGNFMFIKLFHFLK